MLPDMSDALPEWSLPYTVKTVTQETQDFEPFDIVTARTISAVVQLANKEKLNPDSIDWSLRYLWIHTTSQLTVGEFIEYAGTDYKIIEPGDWQLYGYTEAIAEEVKRAPLVITPIYTLTYTAGAGGYLSGDVVQTLYSGRDGSTVTAVPDMGYEFTTWSDGVLTAARTDLDVSADVTVSASFQVTP
jgi:hypothetical protein